MSAKMSRKLNDGLGLFKEKRSLGNYIFQVTRQLQLKMLTFVLLLLKMVHLKVGMSILYPSTFFHL